MTELKNLKVRAASVALFAVVVTGGLAPQAAAETAPAPVPNGSVVGGTIVPLKVDDNLRRHWKLISSETRPSTDSRRTYFSQNNLALADRVADVVDLRAVLGDTASDIDGRSLCHPTNASQAQGFCWSETDDLDGTWVPQGLTGSGEATENQTLVPGRRVVATSWSTTTSHPLGKNAMMRVTFADVTQAKVTYWNALLVTANSSTNFAALGGHADSVTWYKNYLYVSTAAGLAVFDLNTIWKMSGKGSGVGMSGTTSSAAGYTYALPQVNRYEHDLTPGSCGSQFTKTEVVDGDLSDYQTPPCFAGISLDTSGPVPALVTTEVGEVPKDTYQAFNQVRTITRWNLNPGTGLLADSPRWQDPSPELEKGVSRPAQLYTSTVNGAQGIAMNRGRFVVSAVCPGYRAEDGESELVGCLYHGWPNEPVRLWTRAGVYAQNLSYWPATNELWNVNEKIADQNASYRTVFHIPWPEPPVPLRSLTGLGGDLSGDGTPDMLAIRPQASTGAGPGNGNLVRYDGVTENPALGIQAGFSPRNSIGSSWDAMRLVAGVGDLVKSPAGTPAYPDVLAVDQTGALYLYPGVPGGLGARVPLSTGWGSVIKMTGAGDMTDDGIPDLFAVLNTGEARLYPGTPGGSLGPWKVLGSNWDAMRLVAGVGDLVKSPAGTPAYPDVLAVDQTGALYLYPGVPGGLGARVPLSTGWNIVRDMTGAGDLTGDGLPDLVAIWADGTPYLYPGTAGGGLGPKRETDLGWKG
ncbi:hypothetical protein ACFT8P_34595 [Streptomyces sp. NPDC057101]|uniref:hypothetical protein n=1 Tax=Streptomyces sp. NPDC057101 TaxID=3346020 RepID=UPI00362FFCE6